MQVKRFVPHRVEEIEVTNRVGTGVAAIACADAAVVNLGVQAFRRVVTRVGRADRLARRGVALLAKYGPEPNSRVREFAFPVALHADPMDHTATRSLIFAGRGNVVLRAAGDHARFAARAAVEINDHAPFVVHKKQIRN